jgi:hypothetical protein
MVVGCDTVADTLAGKRRRRDLQDLVGQLAIAARDSTAAPTFVAGKVAVLVAEIGAGRDVGFGMVAGTGSAGVDGGVAGVAAVGAADADDDFADVPVLLARIADSLLKQRIAYFP